MPRKEPAAYARHTLVLRRDSQLYQFLQEEQTRLGCDSVQEYVLYLCRQVLDQRQHPLVAPASSASPVAPPSMAASEAGGDAAEDAFMEQFA